MFLLETKTKVKLMSMSTYNKTDWVNGEMYFLDYVHVYDIHRWWGSLLRTGAPRNMMAPTPYPSGDLHLKPRLVSLQMC